MSWETSTSCTPSGSRPLEAVGALHTPWPRYSSSSSRCCPTWGTTCPRRSTGGFASRRHHPRRLYSRSWQILEVKSTSPLFDRVSASAASGKRWVNQNLILYQIQDVWCSMNRGDRQANAGGAWRHLSVSGALLWEEHPGHFGDHGWGHRERMWTKNMFNLRFEMHGRQAGRPHDFELHPFWLLNSVLLLL